MKVNIKEVKSKRELKAFVHFPNELYKGNPYYVPQIESMDRNTLTPSKNHAFEVCEGKYWLAYDEKGQIVGRIAGIINRRYNEKVGRKICRFGWIDFIDDRQVSEALIHTVEQYAREKGMDEMSGPTGFLEFDAAGVLVPDRAARLLLFRRRRCGGYPGHRQHAAARRTRRTALFPPPCLRNGGRDGGSTRFPQRKL